MKTDQSRLYDYGVTNQVARSFTNQYLTRATSKLNTIINRPRFRSVDADGVESEDVIPDEFRIIAKAEIERLHRESEIVRAKRVGWREKLTHAQVTRITEEMKSNKKRFHDTSAEQATTIIRRSRRSQKKGKDSDEEEEEEKNREEAAKGRLMHAAPNITTSPPPAAPLSTSDRIYLSTYNGGMDSNVNTTSSADNP